MHPRQRATQLHTGGRVRGRRREVRGALESRDSHGGRRAQSPFRVLVALPVAALAAARTVSASTTSTCCASPLSLSQSQILSLTGDMVTGRAVTVASPGPNSSTCDLAPHASELVFTADVPFSAQVSTSENSLVLRDCSSGGAFQCGFNDQSTLSFASGVC